MSHFYKILRTAAFVFDYDRTNAYNRFFQKHAKGKVICEIGTGTGVLAHLASIHGAKKIYTYEIQTSMFNFARDVLEDYENIHIFNENAATATFPDDIDFFVHELLGNFVFDEGILAVIKNIKKQYPNALLYPSQIDTFEYVRGNKKRTCKFVKSKYDKEVLSFIDRLQLFNIEMNDCIHYLVTKDPIEKQKTISFNLMDNNIDEINKSLPIQFYWQTSLGNIKFGNYPRDLSTWGEKRQQYP